MKTTSRYVILAGVCAAGFLAGFSARRLSGNSPSAGRDGEAETTSGEVRTENAGAPRAKDLISAASGLRSEDIRLAGIDQPQCETTVERGVIQGDEGFAPCRMIKSGRSQSC